MEIRTIILDDNVEHLSYLENLLSKIEEVNLIQKFINPTKTKVWLQKHKVDLLITDIEMNHLNGLELMSQLKHPPLVIFASSYPSYAAKSFKLEALHYLVKPINEIDLKIGIERAKSKIFRKETEEYIIIKEGHILFHKIKLTDVLFVEADDDYVKVICKEREYRTHCTLKEIASRLSKNFMKTHRSYFVNKMHIDKTSGTFLQIKNYTIPVSRAYKQTIYDKLRIKS
jgi:two-component system, LytTR family, response regulator